MFSILNEIKEYINKKGIPFNDISISYSYFPTYFNQAILNHLRKLTGARYDMGPSEYTLSFDKNGNIYLMIHDTTGKVNLCVTDTYLDIDDNIRFTSISEMELVKEALALESLDDERSMIREMINTNYSNLNNIEKVKLENNIINALASKNTSEEVTSYQRELVNSCNSIISYINYLNDYYMEDLRLEEEENKMQGIMYTEPDKDFNGKRKGGTPSPLIKERNNPIIPANDRISILNNYRYIYRDFAYTSSNREIEYLNYLYKIDTDKFLLVMEPYNGTKFTKMVIINTDKYISKEDFDRLVRYYLELSNRDFDYAGSTVKINHTSLDSFANKVDYAIVGANDKISNPYFVERMKKIKK